MILAKQPDRPAPGTGTLTELLLAGIRDAPGTALRHHEGGRWKRMSYREMESRARLLAKGLIGLGLSSGDRVAILSNTRAEWTLGDLAGATVNTLADHRFGTVGKPLPGCEVRIADDGEVLIRGPHVFAGYFGEKTSSPVDADGWLHTGDLGSLDPDGYITLIGRKKDLIITSSGKNVTPTSIENALRQQRWISQAVVYGDRRPYLTALITHDPDEAPALAEKLDLDIVYDRYRDRFEALYGEPHADKAHA